MRQHECYRREWENRPNFQMTKIKTLDNLHERLQSKKKKRIEERAMKGDKEAGKITREYAEINMM